MSVVTRFAPSPTGFLHIGGLRTALYAFLFARKHNGKLILRIEDTDQNRFVEGAVASLIKSLTWGNIRFDEGPHLGGPQQPYLQSQRTALYRKYAEMLIESGHAYRCFCSPERLTEMRDRQKSQKVAPMYDRHCLYLSQSEIKAKLAAGLPNVVRLKIPHDQGITYHDLVRGDMEIKGHTIDDQVLLKSDQFPTYHLANVVDDRLMGVTHVIRGEEWLPSTPKHIFLYQAFDWKQPQFAHIPLLLNPDKTKLSKRQGHVAVEEYIAEGYLPAAVINYIALLGWNPGNTREIFSLEELVEAFSLERIQKAGAVFSLERMNWFNRQYIKNLSLQEIAAGVKPFLEAANIEVPEDEDFFFRCLRLSCERWNNFREGAEYLLPLLSHPLHYELDLFRNEKMAVDEKISLSALKAAVTRLEHLPDFSSLEDTKTALESIIAERQWKNGQLLWPLRVALTNARFSPGVFELLLALGKTRSLQRLRGATTFLEAI